MATIKLNWNIASLPADLVGWKQIREHLGDNFTELAEDERSVYVIRLSRPFAIYYDHNTYSPCIYIGRGDFRKRIVSHYKNWIRPLSKNVVDLKIEILAAMPRLRNNLYIYKDAEALLIAKFMEKFGFYPLKNMRREPSRTEHVFNPSEISRAFGLGKGPGYHWAIWPMGSNALRRDW